MRREGREERRGQEGRGGERRGKNDYDINVPHLSLPSWQASAHARKLERGHQQCHVRTCFVVSNKSNININLNKIKI